MNFIERGMRAAIEDATETQILDMLYLVIERNPEIAARIINTVLEPKLDTELEHIAREMFPKEYAAITDDKPMSPELIQKIQAERTKRIT
jgi:hypothetical protein